MSEMGESSRPYGRPTRGVVTLLVLTGLLYWASGEKTPGVSAQADICGDGVVCSAPSCTSGPDGGPEECDDGSANSDTEPDACRTTCALAACGDGVVDGDEACDDGNTSDGDACPSDCRLCQSRDQQSCINAVNKRGVSVAKAQGKENVACVKDATRGKLSLPAEECLLADGKGKVEKATNKTVSDEQSKCGPGSEPDFGFTSAAEVNAVAVAEEVEWIHDLFGEDLAATLSTASAEGRCQTTVVKKAEKIAATTLKEFLRCKKGGLKDASICSPADLEDCLAIVAEDARGKIAKTVDKLRSAVAKDCLGVSLEATFPGDCAQAQDFSGCVNELVQCRACNTVNGMDGIDASCDEFDDGVANGTCGGIPPTPTPPPAPTPTATGIATPTVGCDGQPLEISVSPDPIQVQYGLSTSVTAMGSPLPGVYQDWTVIQNPELDVELAFLQQPFCTNQTSCTALLDAPEVEIPAPSRPLKVCGIAEASINFKCTPSDIIGTGTAPIEVGCGGQSAAACSEFCSREEVQGQCGTPCGLVGRTPPAYQATIGSCWKVNVNGTDYCYWDHKSNNSPGLGNLCCPNRCYGGSLVVWGQGVGVYDCTVTERCDDNPEFAGSECVDVTGT